MGSIKGQKHNPELEGKYAHINPNDVVFTPDWLAKQIVSMFDIKGKVLEPCKGEGAFLNHLPKDTEWCEITEGRNYYDYNEKVIMSLKLKTALEYPIKDIECNGVFSIDVLILFERELYIGYYDFKNHFWQINYSDMIIYPENENDLQWTNIPKPINQK